MTTQHKITTPTGQIAAFDEGPADGIPVVMTHSVLSSSVMWRRQAELLAHRGWRVVRIDLRGHGDSTCVDVPATMDDLGADVIAVLDAIGIGEAHYVGLSIGGMTGLGLGVHRADRFASLVICDARADSPPAAAAPWNDRIATARRDSSCAALAAPTIERWFGAAFVQAQPAITAQLRAVAEATSVAGFVRCAEALQQLDYLGMVDRIALPTTLIVGANDGVLPDAMRDLERRIPDAWLEVVADAGHLPNIDQPAAFEAALLRHFSRF